MRAYDAAGSSGHGAASAADLDMGLPGGPYQRFIKAFADRVIGTLLFILVLPLLAVITGLVWMRIGRPVFYRQERIGLNGQPFDLYKIRTMIPDRRRASIPIDGPDKRKTHKSPDDPRVVPIGRRLRSWRLDELPQLWNVVKGDMSLVGPRPEMPEIVADYQDWQHRRHVVKPGVTGLWQISDRNGKLMHECTELDIEYIADIRLGRDLTILARTPAVMFGKHKGF